MHTRDEQHRFFSETFVGNKLEKIFLNMTFCISIRATSIMPPQIEGLSDPVHEVVRQAQ
jgi:hypothetical protein